MAAVHAGGWPSIVYRVLTRLRISSQMLLLVATPLLALTGFSVVVLSDLHARRQTMAELAQSAELGIYVGALVHELQRERGATALFLGASGTRFGEQLRRQYVRTDGRRLELDVFVRERGISNASGVNRLVRGMQAMEDTRQLALSQQGPLDDYLRYYTELNRVALVVIDGVATHSGDSRLMRRTAALSSLGRAKELAGIERAIVGNTLARGGFAEGFRDHFVRLLAEQQASLARFRAWSDPADARALDEALQAPGPTRAQRLRTRVLGDSAAFTGDPAQWFAAQTSRIDAMRRVEVSVAQGLQRAASELRSQASTALTGWTAALALAFVASIALSLTLVRGITGPLGRLRNAALSMADGDFDQDLEHPGDDEIAELTRAFMTMCNHARAQRTDLERSNRELSEFAHGVSHDLQAPLRQIVAFAERGMAANHNDDTPGIETLHTIKRLSADMRALVDGTLRFAESRHRPIELEPVALDALIQDVLVAFSETIRETGATVEVGYVPRVRGHATLLRRLLQNLVDNALKYRSSERPCVIRIESRDDGDMICVSVSDNGTGFAPGDAERIFEPYTRLHAEGATGGVGIGLASVRDIMHRCGGRVVARGTPNEGACFELFFQRAARTSSIAAPAVVDSSLSPVPSTTRPAQAAGRPTLLLVDDDPTDRLLGRLELEASYEIVEAESPESALVLLAEREITVVVSDYRMPTGSGLDFLERVQARHPAVLRVLVSGGRLDGTIVASEAVQVHLDKPVLADALHAALQEHGAHGQVRKLG